MHRVKLDCGKAVELPSARAREFPRVYELATRFLQAATEEEAAAVAQEISSAWASSVDPDELTLDDLWSILQAKAGPKAELLDGLRQLMAEAMRDFVESGQGREMMQMAIEAVETPNMSGEST